MGTFTVTINCDNSAFEGEGLTREIERILQEAVPANLWSILHNPGPHKLRDINGNVVGHAEYTD